MQSNIIILEKRAVTAALKGNWEEATNLNLQILEVDDNNVDALVRLGRAYLQTKQLPKAKKIFKDVLKIDPINQVAKKNLELLNDNKLDLNNHNTVEAKSLIKEPGTTIEINVQIIDKNLIANDFMAGEQLEIKVKKNEVELYKTVGKKTVLVGIITNSNAVRGLNSAKDKKLEERVSFIKGTDKSINLLIKVESPVFKSEKQDIKPYFKEGSINDESDPESEEEVEIVEPEE